MTSRTLTPPQLTEYREAFEVFDTNKDGKIRLPQLRHMMTSLGQDVTESELKDIMETADLDKNGYIDFDEFCHIMHTCAPKSVEEQLRETFKLIDKDGSGRISAYELKRVLKKIGDTDVSNEEIDDLIREIDLDGDGEVDYEDFSRLAVYYTT